MLAAIICSRHSSHSRGVYDFNYFYNFTMQQYLYCKMNIFSDRNQKAKTYVWIINIFVKIIFCINAPSTTPLCFEEMSCLFTRITWFLWQQFTRRYFELSFTFEQMMVYPLQKETASCFIYRTLLLNVCKF